MSEKTNSSGSECLNKKLIFNLSSMTILKVQSNLNEVHVMSKSKRMIPDLNCQNICHLCHKHAEIFYCTECVRYGNFFCSSMRIPDRFAEVKINEAAQRIEFKKWEEKIRLGQHNTVKRNQLKDAIECKRKVISLLKKSIHNERNNIEKANNVRTEVEKIINKFNISLPEFEIQLRYIEHLLEVHKSKINNKCKICNTLDSNIRDHRCRITKDLSTDVLPLVKIEIESSIDNSANTVDMDIKRKLVDALETHYVGGQWIRNSQFNQVDRFQIFSSILPGSGKYADFFINEFSNDEGKKEAQNICAGLSLVCQLVNILANQYDIILPTKVFFSNFNEFTKQELKEKKFKQLVTRLNANALYLSVSLGIPVTELHPERAIPNIIKLLDGKQALNGLNSGNEFESPLLNIADEHLEDLSGDSDSEGEWENVSNLSISESIPSYPSEGASYRRPSESPSNMVTSMMSLFKGFSGSPYK